MSMKSSRNIPEIQDGIMNCTWIRYGLITLGLASTGLGIAGIFLPVMPSTVFFLIALWAFSKSSRRLHEWLYTHPKYGPCPAGLA